MAIIVIDYENRGIEALKGIHHLNSKDALYIGQIMTLVDENKSNQKTLYLGALKSFGREDGRVIFNTLKKID